MIIYLFYNNRNFQPFEPKRESRHKYDYNYKRIIHKKDISKSQDKEIIFYLDARDKFKGKNIMKWQTKKQRNIPNDWKKNTKCRKQWEVKLIKI